MLDIKLIREKPDYVTKALAKRNYDVNFDAFLTLDVQRKEMLIEVESLKNKRNTVSRQIPQIKKEGGDAKELLAQMKVTSDQIKEMDETLRGIQKEIDTFMSGLPNLPDDDVVAGGKENNEVLSVYGTMPSFDFEPKDHVNLATSLNLIDYERGAKLGGNGFWIYTGMGAQLEWALLNYFISEHIKDGYEFMLPPHMLNYACGYTAGQFPKFEEDVFNLEEGNFMLPTSETALVNLYRDEILKEDDLPKRLFAYTPCYRREAGSYRAEERGMIRGHQFNKVEMFAFTTPEQSDALHQELTKKACALVEGLGLHYQLSKLAAGDVGAAMASTYDIEVYLPSMCIYKEVSSISNSRDYQARRGMMRYKNKDTKKNDYIHTLNGSGLATSRILPAILEQFQNADGSVNVPKPLQAFVGTDVIKA
ncbi:MAG: serine--tRNA ligase [Clostridiales bacterium]|nr:serine--tRNA ligase [Clostridiales bacterium]